MVMVSQTSRLLTVLLLTCLLGWAARAEEDAAEEKIENSPYPPAFRERVDKAIDLGAHWLLLTQKDDGSWDCPHNEKYPLGPTALATLAAIKSGVPGDHPRIERAFDYMREQPLTKTYSVAILLMALDARYEPAPETFATEPLDQYGKRVTETPCEAGISKHDLTWMKQAMAFLIDNQRSGHWRYPSGNFDLSNTQYALLGLKAGSRCGIKVPSKVWADALEFHLDYQQKEGEEVIIRINEVRGDYRIEFREKAAARGFGYVHKSEPTGSMTTAGLAGLLICQSELWKDSRFNKRLRERTRVGIRDGFAWLQANFTVYANPMAGVSHHYYYLYGLERACILGHTRFVGEHDWYEEGAEALLGRQFVDGSWNQKLVESCFALLFLKRASFRIGNSAITPRGEAPPDD